MSFNFSRDFQRQGSGGYHYSTVSAKDTSSIKGGELVIPSQDNNGGRVERIKENGFSGCSNINSVIIPDTVRMIGKPDYDDGSGCLSLTTYFSLSFSCCNNLISVSVPDTLSFIGAQAFDGCVHLKSFIVRDTGADKLTLSRWRLDADDMYGCTLYVAERHLANAKKNFDKVFYKIDKLENAPTWQSLLSELDRPMPSQGLKFESSGKSTEGYNSHTYVYGRVGRASNFDNGLKNLVIPEIGDNKLIRQIDSSGFSSTNIKTVYLPNSLEYIGTPDDNSCGYNDRYNAYSFKNCTQLSVINASDRLKHIGTGAFDNSFNIKHFIIRDTGMPKMSISNWRITKTVFNDCTLYVPSQHLSTVKPKLEKTFRNVTTLDQIPAEIIALFPNVKYEISKDAPKAEPKKDTPKPQPAPAPKQEPKAEPKKEAPKPEVRRPSADDMNVLDKLIDSALEDFVVTDEERKVLLNKANEIGLGNDEFKLYLNGKIQERMKDKPKEKVEEKKKGFFARLFGR